ncbi:MAG: hypothetical protein V4721_08460 [Bacteroidota bacterium]
MAKRILLGTVALILLAPLLMWLAWFFTPKKTLVVAIIDKTVLTTSGQEHISLNWVLNHERYTKTSSESYKIDRDYFGFFPLNNEQFKVKGLEQFTSSQLKQLSSDADLVYFTDTYGIFNNEWYIGKNINERSGMLYGGLSNRDIELLELMKARKKLIIAEFNTIGSPTDSINRSRFEGNFGVRWTGWTGRFFDKLDTALNKEIPLWLINNYKKSHDNKWPFKKAGIAFVSITDEVIILEDDTHLGDPLPHIISNSYGQQNLSLPAKIKYPFWFDILMIDSRINKEAATFKIDANANGLEELRKSGIPASFPAVTYHKRNDYTFYYFSGDFCDNPVPIITSHFKGISLFKAMFYNESDPVERSSFFWNFYRPMMTNILKEAKRN